MSRTLPIAVLLTLAGASAAIAQEVQPPRFDAARYAPAPALPAPDLAAPDAAMVDRGPDAVAEPRQERSLLRTVLHTVGGAVVGGWVGFVGSQVALSDWDKETNGSFTSQRTAWVAGGVVAGVLGSRLFRGTSSPGAPPMEVIRPRGDRNILTREQIESSGASSVYDLVLSLRKDWLVPRGTQSFRESARGSGSGMGPGAQIATTPGQARVVVYLDDIRIGEVERMREILINDIMEITFVEPHEAAYRYGAGHGHGVIALKTIR